MSDRFSDWMILIMRFFYSFIPYFSHIILDLLTLHIIKKENRLCSASRVIYEIDVRGILI